MGNYFSSNKVSAIPALNVITDVSGAIINNIEIAQEAAIAEKVVAEESVNEINESVAPQESISEDVSKKSEVTDAAPVQEHTPLLEEKTKEDDKDDKDNDVVMADVTAKKSPKHKKKKQKIH